MNQHTRSKALLLSFVTALVLALQGCASSPKVDLDLAKKPAEPTTNTQTPTPAEPKETTTGQVDPSLLSATMPPHIVYFEFDSAEIRATSLGTIEALARYYRDNRKAAAIVLEGHADERGSREYNLALGHKRASAVLRALTLLGVPESRAEAISFGEEKPAATGSNEAAWELNRRVEVMAR